MSTGWNPPQELSSEESRILQLCKKQKLWGFLRQNRHLLIDGAVRAELSAAFRPSGRGPEPVAPECLALAMLLQVAFGAADHEVPTLTAVDRRWQMVLDCMGATEPAFSQGTVFNFRERSRRNGIMRRLLDRTVELARETRGFDHKRLRALIDSSPLVGAGRVEDTFNLLGRAIAQLVEVAAEEASSDIDAIIDELELTVVSSSSVKAALDVDWREPQARSVALTELLAQFERVQQWLREQFDEAALSSPPLSEHIETVERIIEQDTEPDPDSPSGTPQDAYGDSALQARRIRQGAKPDRLISLSDQDMRYGRKSRTKVFPGYKRHIATDADVQGLICDVEVVPANQNEHKAAAPLLERLEGRGYQVSELHIDRGYLPAEAVIERRNRGMKVISKPPTPRRSKRFTKSDFAVDFDAQTITCPTGVSVPLRLDGRVTFPRSKCQRCNSRDDCLSPKRKQRQIELHPQERWYRQMARELSTKAGRAKRRERIQVEHSLARVGQLQGTRARFRGREKNQFDLERIAVVNNCYVLLSVLEAKKAA